MDPVYDPRCRALAGEHARARRRADIAAIVLAWYGDARGAATGASREAVEAWAAAYEAREAEQAHPFVLPS